MITLSLVRYSKDKKTMYREQKNKKWVFTKFGSLNARGKREMKWLVSEESSIDTSRRGQVVNSPSISMSVRMDEIFFERMKREKTMLSSSNEIYFFVDLVTWLYIWILNSRTLLWRLSISNKASLSTRRKHR